ncbi:hypothetical protein HMPREF1585_01410 [Gardnerella vaginalis JCP8481B]|nr:hypothetical protein HMPREF1585_01410 [Gardnerella vaginalis JCP8481B]
MKAQCVSTQARSAFVSIDEGRAESCGCSLGIWLCSVCADDLLERNTPNARKVSGVWRVTEG